MKEIDLLINKDRWITMKLGDLASEVSQRIDNPASSNLTKFVGLQHFTSGDIRIKSYAATDNLTSSTKGFKAGDILFARRNAYLKRASLVDFDGMCSGDAFVLRENHERIKPRFLAYIVNSSSLWTFANSNAAGTMSKRVKWRDLEEYQVRIPSISEQETVLELLDAVSDLKEKTEKQLVAFEKYFEAWLNERISTKHNWNRKPLSKVASVQTGIAKNKAISGQDGVVKKPYIRVANVQDGYLDLKEVKNIDVKVKDLERFTLKNNDLLLTEGGDFDKLGRGYVWQNEVPNCLHQNHVFSVRANTEVLNPWFLSLLTRSQYGKQYFLRCAKKTSNLASINSSQLKELRVLLPNIDIQNKIVEEMMLLNENLELLQKQKKHLEELQQDIINKVF
jgi:restriction endonuclease S subunit